MKTPAELTVAFREHGYKVTPQRQCIFRVLHGNSTHPTAESVYAAAAAEMPTMSLKTVYSTLHDLAAMGEILHLDLGTGSTRFDPNIDGHHHLVCTGCGKVRDLHVDLGALAVPVEESQGFTVGSAEVVFRGLCEACSTATPTTNPTSSNPTSSNPTSSNPERDNRRG